MIRHSEQYESFIKQRGVGANDKVADSVKSYISYLNSVSKYLDITIGPETLCSDEDVQHLSKLLKGKVSAKTIKNYGSAMKQYVKMVKDCSL